MARRGQQEWNLTSLVLLLCVLAVVIALLIRFAGVWRATQTQADCAAEVRSHAAIARASQELVDPSTIGCPTNVLHAVGEVPARAVIANEMRRCFDQWGRGDLSLFGSGTGAFCHVCGMVYVEGTPQVNGLMTYLSTERAPGTESTYVEDLLPTIRGNLYRPEDAPALAEDTLSTARPIAVIFRYEKGAQFGQRVRNWVADPALATPAGFAGGIAMGVAVGASGGTIAVLALGGAVMGATTGYISQDPLDTVASVNARTLDPSELKTLGCQYVPVVDD